MEEDVRYLPEYKAAEAKEKKGLYIFFWINYIEFFYRPI